MKNLFQPFRRPSEAKFKDIWKNCVFIVDTNVILNLYRYPQAARDELLNTFKSTRERIWIPFHAALEYQRNRPNVIAEQKKRFSEVRTVVEKLVNQFDAEFAQLQLRERHNLIDPDPLTKAIKSATADFLDKLNTIEHSQFDVNEDDPIRELIEELFDGRIGPAPSAQWVEELKKKGDERFNQKLPPGFADARKGDDAEAIFNYGGVVYEKKLGDLIIWQQILDYVGTLDAPSIIFLTDDAKDDWWWIVDSRGKKRLGPRPELIEEILRVSRASDFYIYRSEQFLKFSKLYLNSVVSDETISQVREISSIRQSEVAAYEMYVRISQAVTTWLSVRYSQFNIIQVSDEFPDIIVESTDRPTKIGIEYTAIRKNTGVLKLLRQKIKYADYFASANNYDLVELVIVVVDDSKIDTEEFEKIRLEFLDLSDRIKIYIGNIAHTPYGVPIFESYYMLG